MKKVLTILVLFCLAKVGFSQTLYDTVGFQAVLVPKYMGSNVSSGGARLPVVFRAKLTNLNPNTTYRFYTNLALYSDLGTTNSGAGNPLFIASTNFRYTSSVTLATGSTAPGNSGYDSLTTDGSGNYEGWFGVVNTGNARFTKGNYVHPSIVLSYPGLTTNTVAKRWAMHDSIQVIEFSTGTGANDGTGIYGFSSSPAQEIVALYENTSDTRPSSMTFVETSTIGGSAFASLAGFYTNKVRTKAGAWGTIIRNSNSTGIRKIERHSFSSNAVIRTHTDADGVWPSGADTRNAAGDSTNPIFITNGDASLLTATPTITLDQSGFTNDFGLTYPNVPSSGSNFLVSGSDLTDSITITVAAPFEIRIGVNPYASGSIKLVPSSGTVNMTVLDVRFNPTATGTFNDTIYFTSSGATTQKVWVKGTSSNAPEVSFKATTLTVNENAGTVKVQVNIANASSLSTSVDVVLATGTTATAGSDFTFSSPNTITFPANSSDSIVLNIPIANDNIVESNESFILVLTNATNGASIGSNDSITITIADDDYRHVNIASVATANGTGVYDSTGKRFEVTGVVYGINQRNVGAGLQFVLRDATGGLNVFSGVNLYGYTVKQGDSVTVRGTLSPFNGLAEIVLNTANIGDTIIYHAANRSIKTPKVISVLGEAEESDLVQLNGVRAQAGGAWISGNNNIITAAGDTLVVRIVSNTNTLIGKNKPTGKFNIIGLGGQFDNTVPYTSGYQLFPRDTNDVIIPVDSLAHFVLISPSNGATVSISGSSLTSIDFAWDQALPAQGVQAPTYDLYIDEDSGTFASPLLVYQSNLGGTGTQKSVYYDTLISIIVSKGLNVGQSLNLKWNVKATTGGYSRWADSSYSLVLTRGVMNGIHKNNVQLMAMYPNPAAGSVTISVPAAIISAEAYSLDGKLAKTFATNGNNSEILDVTGLANGIYMLNVTTAEGTFIAKLVVKK